MSDTLFLIAIIPARAGEWRGTLVTVTVDEFEDEMRPYCS